MSCYFEQAHKLDSPEGWLAEIVCPHCRCHLEVNSQVVHCTQCGKDFALVDGIPDFRYRDEYWCNVSREKMQELNGLAKATGDWLTSAKKIVPQYVDHFIPFDRADMQFLWPTTKDSIILDAGSMWGGWTIPAAQYHKEVYAVDKTLETLLFLKLRSEQMGFQNIHLVASPLRHLPFPDRFFDLVILNGVLEWVAFDQDVILERHWGKRRDDKAEYSEDPTQVQLAVLRELYRVIKPGGCLYLAIENRIGYIYLLGYPDDHMNIPFICFLPRRVANVITRWKLGCDYRTYVYTIPGYRFLLEGSGFSGCKFYGAFNHYNAPRTVIPLDLVEGFRGEIARKYGRRGRAFWAVVPSKLIKYFSPSVIALATKGISHAEGRVIRLLKLSGVVEENAPGLQAVKYESRRGNNLAVNYLVYSSGESWPRYFCKICRNKESTEFLASESRRLLEAHTLLRGTGLDGQIPKWRFFGTVDGITFLVTEFINARVSGFDFNSELTYVAMRRLNRAVNRGMEFLCRFQSVTVCGKVSSVELIGRIEEQRCMLGVQGLVSSESEALIGMLEKDIAEVRKFSVPVCAVHGDFDLFYNILFDSQGVRVVDFEHFEPKGLPFLDLMTLLFNPILVSREYVTKGVSLESLLSKGRIRDYMDNCLARYAEMSGVPRTVLRFAAGIAALEQRTKVYLPYRDPNTFPINRDRAFSELLKLRL